MKKISLIVLCFTLWALGSGKFMVVDHKDNGKIKFPIESIDSVYFEFDGEYGSELDYGFDDLNLTVLSAKHYSGLNGYEDFVVQGNLIYAVGDFGARKIDWSDVSSPILLQEKILTDVPGMKARSIVQNGDYLYVTMRQKSSGVKENIVPDFRITFESNITNFEPLYSFTSTNSIFNSFFKKLDVKSVDVESVNTAYLYPARYEKGVYRNVIRLKNVEGKSVLFVSHDYATLQESLASLKSSYKNTKGDYCEVDWDVLEDSGVILKDFSVHSSTEGMVSNISDNPVIKSFFKKLRISSRNPSTIATIYIYKAKLEKGLYRNVIRLQDDNDKSILFLKNEYASSEKALQNLSSIYSSIDGDYCEVDWDALESGASYVIKSFSLNSYGSFDSFKLYGNASISESASPSPSRGNYAAKLTNTDGTSAVVLSRYFENEQKSGEVSLWIKNVNDLNGDAVIPVLRKNGSEVVSLLLSPAGGGRFALGLKTSNSEMLSPAVLNNGEWYNVKLAVLGSELKLGYRTKEAGAWTSLLTLRSVNINFDAIAIGLETSANAVEVHVDDIFYATNELDRSAYVNGKLLVLDKKNLDIKETYNLDLKGTGSAIAGNALVVNFLKGVNVYDVSNPLKPQLVKWIRSKLFKEYQNAAAYEHNERKYVIICNYQLGYTILDVTNPYDVQIVKEDEGEDLVWNGYSMYRIGYNFDVVVDYPYVYFTSSTITDYLGTELDKRGILVMDISDLNHVKKSYVFADPKDVTTKTAGDTRPTRIVKMGPSLILNNGDKGLLLFDATNPASLIYKGNYEIPGASYINAITKYENKIIVGDEGSLGNVGNFYIIKAFD